MSFGSFLPKNVYHAVVMCYHLKRNALVEILDLFRNDGCFLTLLNMSVLKTLYS